MCSIFDVGGKSLYKRLEMVVDELGNSFSRVAIAGNDGPARVALLVNFR